VGLALGSGGARGWAHLGVLRALRKKGVEVQVVAGTSMGSIVGAFFAAGRIEALEELADQVDWSLMRRFLWELSLSRSGLTDGRRLLEETRKRLEVTRFQALKTPFRAVATDLDTGGEVVLDEGDLLQAVRASISIPGIFSPVWIGKRLLVDGGLVNPVPVNVARDMGAQVVIAVDVCQGAEPGSLPAARRKQQAKKAKSLPLPKPSEKEESAGAMQVLESFFDDIDRKVRKLKASWAKEDVKPDLMEVLVRSVRIAEAQIARTRREVEPPDILIEPKVGKIGTLEFQRVEEAVEAGYAAALKALE